MPKTTKPAKPKLATATRHRQVPDRYYLAYGSNLNVLQMSRRCPDAKPLGTVVLPDMRLVFRGVADIEEHMGGRLHLGLWKITPRCERALDAYEGVTSGLYRREFVTLEVTERNKAPEIADALIYRMNSNFYEAPWKGYYDTIAQGFRDFGLPLAALERALNETFELETLN